VRKHTDEPNSYTGWHTHPGPVFITVTQGSLTFYSYKDGECRRKP
jgi:quercetin dioxygenase-like cupin family protein